jgi:hypothetical protein
MAATPVEEPRTLLPTLDNVGPRDVREVVHNHIDRLAHRYFFWTAHGLKSVEPVTDPGHVAKAEPLFWVTIRGRAFAVNIGEATGVAGAATVLAPINYRERIRF